MNNLKITSKQKIYKDKTVRNTNMLPRDQFRSLDDSFKTLVFIDAGFLSKLSRYFGKGKYLVYDLISFSKNLAEQQNLEVKKIFYYTAPPFQSHNPSTEEKLRKDKYDRFIRKLSHKNLIIREGRCQKIVSGSKIKFSQKGVDTLMTLDLASAPLKYPKIKKIILIACDSDFVPVINQIREFGIKIILYTYFTKRRNTNFSRSFDLMKSVNEYVKIKQEDFENAPFNEKLKKKSNAENRKGQLLEK